MQTENLTNVFKSKDLAKKVIFVLLAIAAYRIGASIPIPGINPDAIRALFRANQGGVLGFLDIFSGGALGKLSIFSLGVMPYINSSIIMSLVQGAHIFPYIERLSKEGETGRRKITQITRLFTLLLAVVQSIGLTLALNHMPVPGGMPIVYNADFSFYLTSVLSMTTGTVLIMWIGEQITERGIGNGISLIIFTGIVERLPKAIIDMLKLVQLEEIGILSALTILALIIVIMVFVVWLETAQRKIPVQYAQRMVGRKMYGGVSTFLPLKVDQSGVIAVIFAISFLTLPYTITTFNPNSEFAHKIMTYMSHSSLLYQFVYMILIVFFCYFYNSVAINPKDLAENMKKWGGFIPGIRPGEATAKYIENVLNKITLGGALAVSAIAILPDYLRAKFNVPFYFGGTSLLIVVGVALDTIAQLEAHLLMRNYDGLYKNKKIQGRWFNVGSK
ncbi:MAG: preprotein translocase subunit SecY [Elusimicrobiales bacterium]|nr:preprotein translocase subunit SecY [Elusimicrobiales bacterium]